MAETPLMPSLAGRRADYITPRMILSSEGLHHVPAMAEPAAAKAAKATADRKCFMLPSPVVLSARLSGWRSRAQCHDIAPFPAACGPSALPQDRHGGPAPP